MFQIQSILLPKCLQIIYSNMNQITANPMCYAFNTSLFHVISVEEYFWSDPTSQQHQQQCNRTSLENTTSLGKKDEEQCNNCLAPILEDTIISFIRSNS